MMSPTKRVTPIEAGTRGHTTHAETRLPVGSVNGGQMALFVKIRPKTSGQVWPPKERNNTKNDNKREGVGDEDRTQERVRSRPDDFDANEIEFVDLARQEERMPVIIRETKLQPALREKGGRNALQINNNQPGSKQLPTSSEAASCEIKYNETAGVNEVARFHAEVKQLIAEKRKEQEAQQMLKRSTNVFGRESIGIKHPTKNPVKGYDERSKEYEGDAPKRDKNENEPYDPKGGEHNDGEEVVVVEKEEDKTVALIDQVPILENMRTTLSNCRTYIKVFDDLWKEGRYGDSREKRRELRKTLKDGQMKAKRAWEKHQPIFMTAPKYGLLKFRYDVSQRKLRAAEKALQDADEAEPDSTTTNTYGINVKNPSGNPHPIPKAPPDREWKWQVEELAVVTSTTSILASSPPEEGAQEGATPFVIDTGDLLSWAEWEDLWQAAEKTAMPATNTGRHSSVKQGRHGHRRTPAGRTDTR
jgi:hypothetical protein